MMFLTIIFVVLVTIIRFKLLEKINFDEDFADFVLVIFWISSIVLGVIFCVYFWEASPLAFLFLNKEHVAGITGWMKGFLRRKILEFIDDKKCEECRNEERF